ncbi:hypothetical protein ACFGVR_11215 [Mucilaginibacter sp. AW1-3]
MIARLFKLIPKTPKSISLFLVMILLFNNTGVRAGGNPVGKKRLFIIVSTSYYFANTFWDENGQQQQYPDNGKYTTLSLSVNAEYGFSRRIALVASLPFSANYFKSSVNSTTTSSLGDASVGMSYYLANIAYRTYFSVQGNFVFPVYQNTATVIHGYGDVGANAQFLVSGDFKLGEKSIAFGGTVGASQFFGELAPLQLTLGGNLGMAVSKKNQLSIAATAAASFSPEKAFDPTSPAPAKDYRYTQITLNFSHNISRNKSLFFSGTRFLVGKNTGIGNTITAGFTYKF